MRKLCNHVVVVAKPLSGELLRCTGSLGKTKRRCLVLSAWHHSNKQNKQQKTKFVQGQPLPILGGLACFAPSSTRQPLQSELTTHKTMLQKPQARYGVNRILQNLFFGGAQINPGCLNTTQYGVFGLPEVVGSLMLQKSIHPPHCVLLFAAMFLQRLL